MFIIKKNRNNHTYSNSNNFYLFSIHLWCMGSMSVKQYPNSYSTIFFTNWLYWWYASSESVMYVYATSTNSYYL